MQSIGSSPDKLVKHNDPKWESGHLIDTLNYVAIPTPKSCRFLVTLDPVGLPQVLVLVFHLVNLGLDW